MKRLDQRTLLPLIKHHETDKLLLYHLPGHNHETINERALMSEKPEQTFGANLYTNEHLQ